MAKDSVYSGVKLSEIVTKMNEFASEKLAADWDNVGLLIDPMENKQIKSILLTNDLTEIVMKEAVDLKVDMIISYHPPIFKSLKRITASTWKERIVVSCLKNGIALFSPHTSWDAVKGGVNDWLCKPFEPMHAEPLDESGFGRLCQIPKPKSLKEYIEIIKKHIGIPHLRLALAAGHTLETPIRTVGICAGAGTTLLAGIKADLYLTGEMLHHDVLEANHCGASVILCNHSDSERGFLKDFKPILQNTLLNGTVNVHVSTKDSDPLFTI